MKVLSSPSRIRFAALLITVVGLITFVGAQSTGGRLSIVLISVSLALFILEVIFGVMEARTTRYED